MNISTALFALMIVISQSSFAIQDEHQKRLDIDSLASQLQLGEGQSQQLKTLMAEHRQQMKTLRQQNQQSREQMRNLRDQHRESLLTVLSYEQLYKFEKFIRQTHPRSHWQKKQE